MSGSLFPEAPLERDASFEIRPKHDGPGLTASDQKRLGTQQERVRSLMLDGKWRTLGAIKTHIPEASESGLSARLRDLRKEKHGSYIVERRCVPNKPGLFEYRVAR